MKADAWKGKRKIKDKWDEETWEVSTTNHVADVPSYEGGKPTQMVASPPPKLASSHCIRGWHSACA